MHADLWALEKQATGQNSHGGAKEMASFAAALKESDGA